MLSTGAARIIVGSLFALGAVYHREASTGISHFWLLAREHWIVKHDSFEPLLSTLTFFVVINIYRFLDKSVPSLRKYMIQKSDDFSHWGRDHSHPWEPRFLSHIPSEVKHQTVWYLAPILIYDALYPRRVLPAEAPSLGRLAGEVLMCLLVYDALFTVCHFAMHKSPLLYRRVHAVHHRKTVQRATEAVALSFAEEVVDVACSVAAVNLTRSHPLSRALYDVLVSSLIVELHSGYAFPWMLQDVVPWGLWGGSRRHDLHHRTGRKHYAKFFGALDGMLRD